MRDEKRRWAWIVTGAVIGAAMAFLGARNGLPIDRLVAQIIGGALGGGVIAALLETRFRPR